MTEDQVVLMATVAGLRIDPAYLPGVLRNLEILLGQAGVLRQQPLSALVEPAPVYRP